MVDIPPRDRVSAVAERLPSAQGGIQRFSEEPLFRRVPPHPPDQCEQPEAELVKQDGGDDWIFNGNGSSHWGPPGAWPRPKARTDAPPTTGS